MFGRLGDARGSTARVQGAVVNAFDAQCGEVCLCIVYSYSSSNPFVAPQETALFPPTPLTFQSTHGTMPGNPQNEHDPPIVLNTPAQPSRQKQPRSSSPGPSSSNHPQESRPPPTKRARKAINCEPCRNSKLKCDRSVSCL